MKILNPVRLLLVCGLLVMVFASALLAEEFSILFSASVQGETEPCG
ncbi:MAG: hypothetical protein ACP5FZ_07655 [Fidelibacterota bacterium]